MRKKKKEKEADTRTIDNLTDIEKETDKQRLIKHANALKYTRKPRQITKKKLTDRQKQRKMERLKKRRKKKRKKKKKTN